MTIEEVDDWDNLFENAPGPARRVARQERARKEKRTQLSEKQRRRTAAVRTTQFNFRCSEDFKSKATRQAKTLGLSIPDYMELLVERDLQQGEVDAG